MELAVNPKTDLITVALALLSRVWAVMVVVEVEVPRQMWVLSWCHADQLWKVPKRRLQKAQLQGLRDHSTNLFRLIVLAAVLLWLVIVSVAIRRVPIHSLPLPTPGLLRFILLLLNPVKVVLQLDIPLLLLLVLFLVRVHRRGIRLRIIFLWSEHFFLPRSLSVPRDKMESARQQTIFGLGQWSIQ